MATPVYCTSCGRARAVDGSFCAGCGRPFDQLVTPVGSLYSPATPQQGMAQSALQVQALMAKVVVGRIVGLVVGILAWFFLAGPLFIGNFLLIFVSLVVLAFVGLYVGQTLVLMAMAGNRR